MGILVCGLNGCGKSTVGRILAGKTGFKFIDNEDLYFAKDDPDYLFSAPRSRDEVVRLLESEMPADGRFVFAAVSGNSDDYGEKLAPALELIVLIEVPKAVRMERVRARSFGKFGERMLEGGDLYERESAFFRLVESRPEDYVTKWLGSDERAAGVPVLRIDGTLPPEENVGRIITFMSACLKTRSRTKTAASSSVRGSFCGMG